VGFEEEAVGVQRHTEQIGKLAAVGARVIGVDLAPRGLAAGRAEAARRGADCRFLRGDVRRLPLADRSADLVLLPDVIEHIPLGRHDALFRRVAGLVKPDGFVLVHYPNPHYLRWCQEHRPEVLQVIDQPIEAEALLEHACAYGLYLESLETYSIWVREGDYVAAVLRPRAGVGDFTQLPPRRPSLAARARARLRRMG